MTRIDKGFEFWLHCGETFHVQDGSYAACGSISRVQACLVYGWVLKAQTLDLIEVNSCLKPQQKAGPASNGLRQKDSI